MAAPTFAQLKARYTQFWRDMSVHSNRVPTLDAIARKLLANKARYQKVEAKIRVPWWFIAILHNRESSGNFAGVLHNGEHIIGTGKKTRLVPAGRGPFSTWEEAAEDALKMKGLHKITDWSVERVCYEGERFNGFGYYFRGVPSAYLWSFSNIYQGGKYIADGVWSAAARDAQAGIMPLLARMMKLDSSIRFSQPLTAPAPTSSKAPEVATIGGGIAGGAGAVTVAVDQGASGSTIALIVVLAIVVTIAAFVLVKKLKGD
jgi:lysozyme family protein